MQFPGRQSKYYAIVWCALTAAAALFVHGVVSSAADKKPPAADAPADSKTNTNKEKPLKPEDIPPETFVVPQGGPKELLRFIHKIDALRPEFDSEAKAEKFLTTSRNAILAAADKVLQSKPTSEQEADALKAKLYAYQVLVIVGVPDAVPKAVKFADTLKNDKRPALAELGESAWLDFKLSTIPSVSPKERRALVDAVAAALRKKPQTFVELAMHVGRMLEALADGETAVAAYTAFGEVLSRNLDENLRTLGGKMKSGAVRRARLLTGEPLKVAGTTIDGKPFDLKEYKGKVILVDFWATWCGPCVAEIPNVKNAYDKYHARGFEVVGVSLDDDRGELVKFLKENEIPWKTLYSADPNKKGLANPIADHYGISGIPTVFLVNRQGKVVSLDARGEQLADLVENLLGQPGGGK